VIDSHCKQTLALFAALCLTAPHLYADPQSRDRKSNKITRQCEITLRLIEARSVPVKTGEDASALVPAELKNLLRFKHYGLIDSAYVRGREDETLRIALAVTLQGRLKFFVEEREQGSSPSLRFEVAIEAAPNPKGERLRLLETETALRNGESVVLGASRMQGADRALIVILTARLIP
jgi:hypothetical protein